MRRGVLKLSPEELEIVIRSVEGSSYENKSVFLGKLNLAQNDSQSENSVDVNEQDVEALLDSLGIPMTGEPQETANLRTKLQNIFLNDLG